MWLLQKVKYIFFRPTVDTLLQEAYSYLDEVDVLEEKLEDLLDEVDSLQDDIEEAQAKYHTLIARAGRLAEQVNI